MQMSNKGNLRKELHFSDRVVNCFVGRPKRVIDKIDAVIADHPEKTAIVDARERVTYAELDDRSRALAGQFRDRGLNVGDRVGIVVPNRVEFVVALLAVWRLGAVPVPINTREAAPETAFILEDCVAAGLIYDPGFPHAIPEEESVPTLFWRLSVDDFSKEGTEPVHQTPVEIYEDDMACLMYTSGTTGKPKGAMLSHLGTVHSMLHYEHHLGIGPSDTSLLVVPATHITGLIGLILVSLGSGAKLVMVEDFRTDTVIRIAERESMTYTIMVPAMYNLLLLREDFSKHDLSAWRVGAYGGAVMPVNTIEQLSGFLPGLNLVNAYGATETTSPTSFVPLGSDPSVFNTIGKPVACAEVLIMNGDGEECAAGQEGELWIRGPMVVKGYWNRPEANASDFICGYWRSGDLGTMTSDGFLHIHDRMKDLVNRGGYKVYSSEVENVLLTHSNVIEAAVVPRACPVLGERVHAFIHVKSPMKQVDELVSFCAAELSDYKVPETFTLTNEPLPRNANGKILKRKLRNMLD